MKILWAFAVGGLICVLGQILIDKTALTPAKILTSFVTLGIFFTAVGLYEPLVQFAGAGATVPISGFGYLMANGTREAVESQGALGILTGALSSASAGIAAAITLSVVAALFSTSGDKT